MRYDFYAEKYEHPNIHEWSQYTILKCTSIVASIYPADKKDFRLNPYRVFGVNGAEPRY